MFLPPCLTENNKEYFDALQCTTSNKKMLLNACKSSQVEMCVGVL